MGAGRQISLASGRVIVSQALWCPTCGEPIDTDEFDGVNRSPRCPACGDELPESFVPFVGPMPRAVIILVVALLLPPLLATAALGVSVASEFETWGGDKLLSPLIPLGGWVTITTTLSLGLLTGRRRARQLVVLGGYGLCLLGLGFAVVGWGIPCLLYGWFLRTFADAPRVPDWCRK